MFISVLGANNFLYKQRAPLNIHKYFISQHGLLIPLDLLIHSAKNVCFSYMSLPFTLQEI